MSLFTDGHGRRSCEVCGMAYRPHVSTQRYCSAYCRVQAQRREAKSARRIWVSAGRPIINDDRDLRCGRAILGDGA